jgi:hypothetical protein
MLRDDENLGNLQGHSPYGVMGTTPPVEKETK